MQRSADDLIETLDALNLRKIVLVGTSCAGQVQTLFAAQHSDRLSALVYFDGASDPTITGTDVNPQMPDLNTLPRLARSPAVDRSSFAAFRLSRQRQEGMAFPEAEWRQEFAEHPDGTVGESLMSLPIRRAITVDARMKPDFEKIRVPVLRSTRRSVRSMTLRPRTTSITSGNAPHCDKSTSQPTRSMHVGNTTCSSPSRQLAWSTW